MINSAMKRIITGEFVNNPAIPDNDCISVVVNVIDVDLLVNNADIQPTPRWAWQLLYACVFEKYSLLSQEEAAKHFCKGVIKLHMRKQSHDCVSMGVVSDELYADYPEYKNIKIVAHIRGTKFEVPRMDNVNSMSYAVYADENTITYFHSYISRSAYKALAGEKFTK